MKTLLDYTFGLIRDIGSAFLDNRRSRSPQEEREETMSANNKKIRREVLVNGVKIWITANTEQEYADKLLRLSSRTETAVGEKHPFGEYAERWFSVFSRPNVSNVTALTYERQLQKHILPVLGQMNVEDVRPADIQKIFNAMPENTKQETKNKVKIVLNQIFRTALDEGLLTRNPMQASSVKIKGQAANATKPYTVEQMRYLASHISDIKNPTDKAWLALSITLPLRPEEVLGLKWSDIDTVHRTLTVRNTVTHPDRNRPEFKPYTKTASSARTLAFPEQMLRHLPSPGSQDHFVIGGASPISYTALRNLRKRIAKDTGFPEAIVPRRFRTTVATDISAQTHDLKLVQMMLGHANPQMTLKHYDKGRSQAVDASAAIQKCYGLTES